MIAITPKARAPADKNTNALTRNVLSPPEISLRNSNTVSMSDPETAHLVHDDVAEDHPRAGERESHPGEALIPDDGVKIRRHEIEQKEDRDRQAGEKQRGEFALGGERLDLAPHLETLADHRREVLEDFGEVAAGRALDRHGGHEQRQVFLADAEVEVAHRGLDVGAVGDFVRRDAEFGADRVGNSCATRPTATGTGWPARSERTMMSIASGNCAANLLWRRLRMNISTANGSLTAAMSAAIRAPTKSPRNLNTPANAALAATRPTIASV